MRRRQFWKHWCDYTPPKTLVVTPHPKHVIVIPLLFLSSAKRATCLLWQHINIICETQYGYVPVFISIHLRMVDNSQLRRGSLYNNKLITYRLLLYEWLYKDLPTNGIHICELLFPHTNNTGVFVITKMVFQCEPLHHVTDEYHLTSRDQGCV